MKNFNVKSESTNALSKKQRSVLSDYKKSILKTTLSGDWVLTILEGDRFPLGIALIKAYNEGPQDNENLRNVIATMKQLIVTVNWKELSVSQKRLIRNAIPITQSNLLEVVEHYNLLEEKDLLSFLSFFNLVLHIAPYARS